MKRHYRGTFSYLKEFEPELRRRASKPVRSLMETGPFYSMFGVSEATMANFKVVWSSMGSEINACVVSTIQDDFIGRKPVIPEHVLNFIVCRDRDKAFYLCGVLNSLLVNYILQSYSVKGGKNFAPTRILEFLNIPTYNRSKSLHQSIAIIAKELAKRPEDKALEKKLDLQVVKLYGLKPELSSKVETAYSELNS
jgi:hypothetical protein